MPIQVIMMGDNAVPASLKQAISMPIIYSMHFSKPHVTLQLLATLTKACQQCLRNNIQVALQASQQLE